MRIDSIRPIYKEGGESFLVSTRKLKVYESLLDTGAVVEQGVVFRTKYFTTEDDLYLQKQVEETNAKPLLPYIVDHKAYCPTPSTNDSLELYKALRKYISIKEELDLRQCDNFIDKKKMFEYNAFFGKSTGSSTSAKLKEICFYLWLTSGTLNATSGRPSLSVLQYICALLQVDYFTLVPMIMASTISPEKKKYLLETIKKYGLNPEVVEKEDGYVGLYTKFENELPSALGKSL